VPPSPVVHVRGLPEHVTENDLHEAVINFGTIRYAFSWVDTSSGFYPRDAMLARVFATATCPDVCVSVCLSVCPSHAGIVPSRAKGGS